MIDIFIFSAGALSMLIGMIIGLHMGESSQDLELMMENTILKIKLAELKEELSNDRMDNRTKIIGR